MDKKISEILERLARQEKYEQQNYDAVPREQRMLAISPEIGNFYAILLRALGARRILEIGTSVGYSTIWFAESIQNTQNSRITTIDVSDKKTSRARQNLEEAGLSHLVEFLTGDALKILEQLRSRFQKTGELYDFVFIDADKERYVQYFDMVFPMVRLGGIIAADNILEPARYADHISKYTSYVRSNPKVISQLVPIDNGEEITIKISA